MKRVVIESPYRDLGDELAHRYLACCMRDCLRRGETPYSSLLYSRAGCLNDDVPEERELGIEAGLIWGALAEARVVYTNLGITAGMKQGIERAKEFNQTVEYRTLDEEQWPTAVPEPVERRSTQVPVQSAGDYLCTGCVSLVSRKEAIEVPTRVGCRYSHVNCRDKVAKIIEQEAKRWRR